jgi:Xaa-Pro aminopeptidase
MTTVALPSSALDIDPAEFEERRRRAIAIAEAAGVAGIVIWCREGPTLDWYGDVFYFTNYHCPIGQLQDTRVWSSRGHNALVLPVDGEPTLIVDMPDFDAARACVDDARFSMHVPELVGKVLVEKGLDGAKLGLVGRETLLVHQLRLMEESVGHQLEFEPLDAAIEGLRIVKSDSEIALVREAVRAGGESIVAMMEAVKPGATEGSIVGVGLKEFASRGGRPFDIALTSGPGSDQYWTPGAPPHWDATRELRPGDPVHIDLWGPVRGYYMDFARSTIVGKKATAEQLEVLEGAIECVEYVLAGVRPGVTAGELYSRGAEWQRDHGFGPDPSSGDTGLQGFCPCFGHGIGLGLEHPWIIEGETIELAPNMTIAVEAMITKGTVGANFEHDILITADGYEVLDVDCPDRWW